MADLWERELYDRHIEQQIRAIQRDQQQSLGYRGLVNNPYYPPAPSTKPKETQPNKKLLLLK